MNYPYDLYHWSKQYREEALQEVSRRHLAQRGRERSEQHSGRDPVILAWGSVLSLLRGA